jgi:hypothetical protein
MLFVGAVNLTAHFIEIFIKGLNLLSKYENNKREVYKSRISSYEED